MKTANQPKANYRDIDPDEYFSESRMSFGDHIEELRLHLWRAIVGFIFAVIFCFMPFIGKPVFNFIVEPVQNELKAYYKQERERKFEELKQTEEYKQFVKPHPIELIFAKSELQSKLGLKLSQDVTLRAQIKQEDLKPIIDKHADLFTLDNKMGARRVEEVFMVYVKVCLVTGFVVASPWIFFQIWSFIAAGLYPHEKRLVNYYLPFSIFLFLGGVVFCEFVVIPRALEALLWFNKWLNIRPDLLLSEWLGFAIILPLVFGLTFQTPLVMLFVYKVGFVDIAGFGKIRKYAYFGLAIASAVLTPTGDPQTMLLMWVPMCAFYELGIILCKLMPGGRLIDLDFDDSDEVIEV